MNVTFTCKLAQHCWAVHLSHPKHREWLMFELAWKMQGGWGEMRPDDLTLDKRGRPMNTGYQGVMTELFISVNANDTEPHPDDPTQMTANEFDWALFEYPVDKFGLRVEGVQGKRVINGGWVNHGDWENPGWSSHT